jgi:hypothetical protein
MLPLEKVLNNLPGAPKPSGDGFVACCPAHDDHDPSLSIREMDDGRVLLHCHAGCPMEKVVAALGLCLKDLFATGQDLLGRNSRRKTPNTYPTAADAAAAYGLGKPSQEWAYNDADGNEVGRILRWQNDGGKAIRPISKFSDCWRLSAMPAPRPLLNLPALIADRTSPVFVVEGEKCAAALTSLGLLATTSAGGSAAALQTDWKPLANRRVIVLPDNDGAGGKFAETVDGLLRAMNAEAQIAQLDGRPDNGGDVADLLERCQSEADREALRNLLESIAEGSVRPKDTPPLDPSPACYALFPTATLPAPVRTLVMEAAKSIGCDEAAIALPCVAALGVAAANWHLSIKDGWEVPPAVWTILALPSGSQKSPALDITLDYFRRRQEEIIREHYESKDESKGERPKTIWTDNATTEGLDEAFKGNPRGILYGCDELSAWLGTFGLYKNGRSASDEGWYCQRYGGRASHIVRKKNGRHHGCASGMLAVTGCTTISTLQTLLTRSVRECGLMARLVICMPPESKRRWNDATVSANAKKGYYSLLNRLFEDNAAKKACLSPAAKDLFRDFFDRHNEASEQLESEELRPAFSKLEELPARLALILHAAEGGVGDVTGDVMARAIALVEWAKNEIRRAYAILLPGKPDSDRRSNHDRLRELLDRKGPMHVRDVQAGCHAYRRKSASETKADLDSLVASGHARQMSTGAYECVKPGNPDPELPPKSNPGNPKC